MKQNEKGKSVSIIVIEEQYVCSIIVKKKTSQDNKGGCYISYKVIDYLVVFCSRTKL